MKKLLHILNNGKCQKFLYYIISHIYLLIPKRLLRQRLRQILNNGKERPDWNYIQQRVNYYNKLNQENYVENKTWYERFISLKEKKTYKQEVYNSDMLQYAHWFPSYLRWNICSDNINDVPDIPSIVRIRPLITSNQNSILMNFSIIRHSIFVKDNKEFTRKQNKIIVREEAEHSEADEYKESLYRFSHLYRNHPLCDLCKTDGCHANPQRRIPKKTLRQHLNYKFILSLERNDAANNIEWIMSSNSIAVMPRPTCETWFMEGKLIPNYHYIEIKADFSDLEERLTFYITHTEEAQQIINHAHEYVKQFKNKKREKLISLLVLKKYFEMTADIDVM